MAMPCWVRGPVIILEAGLGDGRNSWRSLAPELATSATVFVYDRPGYGGHFLADPTLDSDRDGQRTGAEVAESLHGLLAVAGLQGPYILAGHSIGGLYVQSFAKLYPDETAGLVLIDSRPPAFSDRCLETGAGNCTLPAAMRLLLEPHIRAEYDGGEATMSFVRDPAELGDLPITVLAAMRPGPGASAGSQQLWLEEQRAFADRALNARYVEVPDASHYIHRQRQDLVLSEIRALIDRIAVLPPGSN